MYIYDEEEEKPRKVRILEVLSVSFYVFAVVALALAGFLHTELDPRWVLIPLSLFVCATFLKPFVFHKSWKSLIGLIMVIYYCFTFVLGLFRPDLSKILFLTVNSLLGWALIIALFIGLILGIRRKVKHRVSQG